MVTVFKGQIITLVTLVCTRRALSCELNMLKSITEPLESELAVQVEYDMDEQGTRMEYCPVRRLTL